ncbi:MAG: glucose-1-phosphate thymidylyltransferase [bacterium JZ-2024 1]
MSGGKGTRLRPLTFTQAKQLLPVANKPILFYGLEALAHAGIREVGIVVGETGNDVRRSVGNGQQWNLRVEYIVQPEPLGLAHAVKVSRDYLGESPFIMYLGDNIIKEGVSRFVQQFLEDRPDALILLSPVRDPQRFGVAELQGDRVVRLIEKPEKPPSNLALVGAYIFTPDIHEAIDRIKPSWRGELEITDAIQRLIDSGKCVQSRIVTGWWKDTGKLEDLLEANRILLEDLEPENHGEAVDSEILGRVRIGRGTILKNAVVHGPAIIGQDCRLQSCYIGPFTSLHNRVTVESAELENSIVLEGACISGLRTRIESSLLGAGCQVTATDRRPRTVRLMLGDLSSVVLP